MEITPHSLLSITRLNPLFIRSQIQMEITPHSLLSITCLNPLFIRSQIQMRKEAMTITVQICLNPLFIRSQIQIAPYFQPTNTDTYNSLFCNLSFLSLFSSLHHLISHPKQQVLSAITDDYKFPVTTPFFDLFLIWYNYLNYINILLFGYFSLADYSDFPFTICAKTIDAYTVLFFNNNFIYSVSHFVKFWQIIHFLQLFSHRFTQMNADSFKYKEITEH